MNDSHFTNAGRASTIGRASTTGQASTTGRARNSGQIRVTQPADEIDRLVAAELRRRAKVILAAIGAAAVVAAGVVALYSAGDAPTVRGILLAIALVALAGALAAIWVTNRIPGQLAELFGSDTSSQRRVRRVVLLGKTVDGGAALDATELDIAARYARVMSVFLPLRLVQIGLIAAAIILQQISLAMGGSRPGWGGFATVVLVVLIVAGVLALAQSIVRIVRVRRFARLHAVAGPSDLG